MSTAPETTAVPEQASDAAPRASLADSLDIGSGDRHASAEPSLVRGKVDQHGTAIGTGRRKTSVARVRVRDGKGKITINERDIGEYFPFERDQKTVTSVLEATEMLGKVDVWVRVNGGGPTGQCGAIRLGIARALQAKDAGLHPALSEGGFLTRDGRMVERKKYGRRKARRSFQFSKR
jgi:small subunit ribosomal protein S9